MKILPKLRENKKKTKKKKKVRKEKDGSILKEKNN